MLGMDDIRRAVIDDFTEILAAIVACREKLNAAGISQWDEVYPSERVIGAAINAESLYVLVQAGRILGGVGLDDNQPSEYEALTWSNKPPILIAHHLFVRPDQQRRGFARRLMQFAGAMAARDGASIRLDAYSGNEAALALYDSMGYARVGEVFFPRRQLPFICFEKPRE